MVATHWATIETLCYEDIMVVVTSDTDLLPWRQHGRCSLWLFCWATTETWYHGDNMVAARSDSSAGQPQRLGTMETTWTLPALTHDWYNEIELMT